MPFAGVLAMLDESWRETRSDGFRARLTTFQVSAECPACHGTPAQSARGGGEAGGAEPARVLCDGCRRRAALCLRTRQRLAGNEAVREVLAGIEQRLHFLLETGLGYLTLDREYSTLSGGEAQRVRLATQLGMGLIGVIYVLDEPSIGLHAHDNRKLIETLWRTARPRQHRDRRRARRGNDARRRRAGRTRPRRRHRGRRGAVPGHARGVRAAARRGVAHRALSGAEAPGGQGRPHPRARRRAG